MQERETETASRLFSQRIEWRTAENVLSRAEAQRRRTGSPILDLTESNPTKVALLDDLLAKAVTDVAASVRANAFAGSNGEGNGGKAIGVYAPHPRGLPTARQAIADEYARLGTPVDPERLVLTASSSESYSFLWKLLCDPGDGVLIPEPSYPLFDYLARLDGVVPVSYQLTHDGTGRGRWEIDIGSIDRALASVAARMGALVVVTPNNPTGSLLRENELQALDRRAAEGGFALISDEVFADYVEPASTAPAHRSPPVRCVATRATDALTFSLGGLSKSCGMPQLKLGWILVGGPPHLATDALDRLELVADTYLSVGTPVQQALPELLRAGATIRAAISARIAENRRLLESIIGRQSPLTLLTADGGWSAIIRLPATQTDEAWALALLNEDGVLCHPGYFFDLPGTFLVVSLLPIPDVFAEGVRRLSARVADSVPPAAT